MSRLVVNLVKGEDFESDFPEDIRVKIHGVVPDSVSYLLEGRMDFKSGVEHHLNVTLTSDPSKVKIDIGGEVSGWN
ncbi:MAG: hypothetical protein SOU95_04080 [Candidatus Cryptobacteroides sp.]|nr:hypothetical protein [Bacteroidales bacterium]MDD7132810.1 hypothetical protein [Bacteroidales bacterium]MDY2773679.1 hypothetical protein [Candidatus Cryptobacteroides sp.]